MFLFSDISLLLFFFFFFFFNDTATTEIYTLSLHDALPISNRQLEASRVALTREMKRGGKVWIRLFPDKPITKKPAETRMGKGEGNPERWVAVVQPGVVVFEVGSIGEYLMRRGRDRAAGKAP